MRIPAKIYREFSFHEKDPKDGRLGVFKPLDINCFIIAFVSGSYNETLAVIEREDGTIENSKLEFIKIIKP